MSESDDAGEEPRVSIIVPVYNDPDGLSTTLESLTEQNYPHEQNEILVVDNDSTDDTRSVARGYVDDFEHVRLLIEDEIQSSYAARNRGIRNAEGDVLAFVDADMTVAEDWLTAAVQAMESRNLDYAGCNVQLVPPDDELAAVDKLDLTTAFPVRRYLQRDRFAPTCCLLVRKNVVDDIGPFDDRLISGGDMEFGNRVASAGYDQGFVPEGQMYHPVRRSLRSQLQKSFRVGRGSAQLAQYHPERYGHLGTINPISLALRKISGSDDGDSQSVDPEVGSEANQTELVEISTTDRIAFRAIGVLQGLWYYSGRVRERIRQA